MSDNKLPNLIDKHVGQRLRWRRRELNLSQEKLGELLGLTFQQIQKYERGANRISAGRLYEISRVLETTIPYFYDGAPSLEGGGVQRELAETGLDYGEGETPSGDAPYSGSLDGDTIDLVAAFQSIPDPKLREAILTMVRNAAEPFASDKG